MLTRVIINFYSIVIGQISLMNYFAPGGPCYDIGLKFPKTMTTSWVEVQVLIFYFNFVS